MDVRGLGSDPGASYGLGEAMWNNLERASHYYECSAGKLWVSTFQTPPEYYPNGPSSYCKIQAWNGIQFCDPTAVSLARGFIREEQGIEMLLDWALDNVELGGSWFCSEWEWDDEEAIARNREWLEVIVKEVSGIA